MYLCCGPLRCSNAIRSALPNAAWPGLHQKPLDATIGLLLTLYPPGVPHTTIKTTIIEHAPTLLAVWMAITMRWYYTAHITRWRRFVAFIKATKHHHWTSTRSNIAQSDMPKLVVSDISLWKGAPVNSLTPKSILEGTKTLARKAFG